MLDRFPIVSGANAGKTGPLRASPGCQCEDCAAWRAVHAERQRQRYWADPLYRAARIAREAERLCDPTYRARKRKADRARYAGNAARYRQRERRRYRTDRRYREARKAAARRRYQRLKRTRGRSDGPGQGGDRLT